MSEPHLPGEALLDVKVRLTAELGRARMPLASLVALDDGAIVDLDRTPDDPIEVLASGRRVGTARVVVSEGDRALRLESIDFREGARRAEGAGETGGEQNSSSPDSGS